MQRIDAERRWRFVHRYAEVRRVWIPPTRPLSIRVCILFLPPLCAVTYYPQAGDGFMLPTLPWDAGERNYNPYCMKNFFITKWNSYTKDIKPCNVYAAATGHGQTLAKLPMFYFSPVSYGTPVFFCSAFFLFLPAQRLTWRHPAAAPVWDKGETMVGADWTRTWLWW